MGAKLPLQDIRTDSRFLTTSALSEGYPDPAIMAREAWLIAQATGQNLRAAGPVSDRGEA